MGAPPFLLFKIIPGYNLSTSLSVYDPDGHRSCCSISMTQTNTHTDSHVNVDFVDTSV